MVPDTTQSSEKCRKKFKVFKNDKCVIYDDVRCDDHINVGVGLNAGEKHSIWKKVYGFKINSVEPGSNVDAIYVQQGCSVQVWTGTENMDEFKGLF